MVNKYINSEGLIGVILSGYSGRGWSTFQKNSHLSEFLLFDAEIVKMVLNKCEDSIINEYCIRNYQFYEQPHGSLNLRVEFIEENTQFIILKDGIGEYIKSLKDVPIYYSAR